MVEAIRHGHEIIQQLVKLQQDLVDKAGKPKQLFEAPETDKELAEAVAGFVRTRFEHASGASNKAERAAALETIKTDMLAELLPKYPERSKDLSEFFEKYALSGARLRCCRVCTGPLSLLAARLRY